MAEKRCPAFCNWIYDFETVCRILLKKKSTDSQLGFLFVDFFSATCVYYDTRYGKKT